MKKRVVGTVFGLLFFFPVFSAVGQGITEQKGIREDRTGVVLYCLNCHDGKFARKIEVKKFKSEEEMLKTMREKKCWGYGLVKKRKGIFKEIKRLSGENDVAGNGS